MELELDLPGLAWRPTPRFFVLNESIDQGEALGQHLAPGDPIDAGIGLINDDGTVLARTIATWHGHPSPFLVEALVIEVASSGPCEDADLSKLLDVAIDYYFSRLPRLLTIVIATNNPALAPPGIEGAILLGDHETTHPLASYKIHLWEIARSRRRAHGQNIAERIAFDLEKTIYSGVAAAAPAPQILLGTGSEIKRRQYDFLMRAHGISTKRLPFSVHLTEPQVDGHGRLNEEVLVREPLKHASRWLARHRTFPFVIEDTMLFIEHLNSDFDNAALLPGPDTKRWWAALGNEGILALLGGSTRRRAKYVCQLGLQADAGQYEVFRAEINGSIAEEIRTSPTSIDAFPFTNPHYFHSIFIPDGADKVYAEMDAWEFSRFDYRRACVSNARDSLLAAANRWQARQEELPLDIECQV